MKFVSVLGKIILLLVLVAALGAVVLFSLGSREFVSENSVLVKADRRDVYAHLTRPTLFSEWFPNAKEVIVVDEDNVKLYDRQGEPINAGTDYPGSRFIVVVEKNGKTEDILCVIKECSFGNHLELRLSSSSLVADIRLDIEEVHPDGDKSKSLTPKVTQTLSLRYHAPARIMAALPIGSSFDQELISGLETMKSMVESGEKLAALKEEPERLPYIPPKSSSQEDVEEETSDEGTDDEGTGEDDQ